VLTADPIALDRPELAAAGFRGEVRSVIPVWSDVA
jgi:hypothetical protein